MNYTKGKYLVSKTISNSKTLSGKLALTYLVKITLPFGIEVADIPQEEIDANECLLSAATAMYEALVKIDNDICYKCGKDCQPSECEPHMKLMRVILKAEGN